MELILGSQSPRRQELLRQIGADFTVLTADIDESRFETGDPVQTVCRICEAKARAVEARIASEGLALRQPLILTSDTIVVLDGRIMGKPRNGAEAERMLAALSGREHAVYTAFTLLPADADPGDGKHTEYEKTLVRFRPLTREEILAYVASGEPMDKAGAYGIQGLGAMLVESICGDYFTVMGLPLCRVAQRLRDYGIDLLCQRSGTETAEANDELQVMI